MSDTLRCACSAFEVPDQLWSVTLDSVRHSYNSCVGAGNNIYRAENSTKEVRSTSSTGGQKGVKPERYSLIPKAPLDLLATVYGFGTVKYAAHNYRKGYEWSKSYDALQRHLAAWWERDELDEESGLSHLGHAAFHVFALICFSSDPRYKEFDDRYRPDAVDFEVEPVDRNKKDEAKDSIVVQNLKHFEEEFGKSHDILKCDWDDTSYWSSDGYTFFCKTHEKNVRMPIDKAPGACFAS